MLAKRVKDQCGKEKNEIHVFPCLNFEELGSVDSRTNEEVEDKCLVTY